jgi:hypothetical protein
MAKIYASKISKENIFSRTLDCCGKRELGA